MTPTQARAVYDQQRASGKEHPEAYQSALSLIQGELQVLHPPPSAEEVRHLARPIGITIGTASGHGRLHGVRLPLLVAALLAIVLFFGRLFSRRAKVDHHHHAHQVKHHLDLWKRSRELLKIAGVSPEGVAR